MYVSINCDNYRGGELAAKCLAEAGCKKILIFGGIKNQDMPADSRTKGISDTCDAIGIEHINLANDAENYYTMDYNEYIEQSLKRYPEIDEIFASSDTCGSGRGMCLSRLFSR